MIYNLGWKNLLQQESKQYVNSWREGVEKVQERTAKKVGTGRSILFISGRQFPLRGKGNC